ncbi:porin [Rhodoferax koreense]|nr:porin [Rhodoferax koreense]
MKTILLPVALLACAISTPASAQSGLMLWGIADAWIGQTRHKVGATPPGSSGVVDSGGAQASRWGMRGTEELGAGLRAFFVLEQGISLDSGATTRVSASDNGFNRGAYVGLSGDFGEVRVGRMLTAFDALRGSTNHLYDSSGFASTGQVWGASTTAANGLPEVTGSDYLARGNNTAYYATPNIGDFNASFSYSYDEKTATATGNPRLATGHVKYTSGPLRIGYGQQAERYTTGTNRYHIVAGNYDFGAFKMVGAAQRQIDGRVAGQLKSNEWELGLDAPFGAATIAVGYASSKTKDGAGRRVIDAKGFSLMGTYDLSKRTRLYTAFRQLKTTRADGSTSLDASRLGVGITQKF